MTFRHLRKFGLILNFQLHNQVNKNVKNLIITANEKPCQGHNYHNRESEANRHMGRKVESDRSIGRIICGNGLQTNAAFADLSESGKTMTHFSVGLTGPFKGAVACLFPHWYL